MKQLLKGVSFNVLMDFIREVLGDGVIEELLRDLSPEAQETFRGEIVNAAWYPLEHYSEMEEAIVKRFFRGDITYARKIAAFSMEKAYGDIYRLAFMVVKTPEEALSTLYKFWELYHSPGRAEMKAEKCHVEARLTDVCFIPDIHKEHLCGWGEKLLEKLGAKNPRLTWKQDGDDIVFDIRWEEPED